MPRLIILNPDICLRLLFFSGRRHLIVYYPRVIHLLVRLPSLIGLTVYSVISNSAGSDIFDYAFQNVVLFHGVSKSALSDTLV